MTGIRHLALATAFASALTACGQDGKQPSKEVPKTPARASAESLSAAYDRGLDFLAATARDGAFSLKKSEYPSAGATALCMLPFIERPGGVRGKDRPIVDRGLAFLAGALG